MELLPAQLYDLFHSLTKLEQEFERAPRADELAHQLDMKITEINEQNGKIMKIYQKIVQM